MLIYGERPRGMTDQEWLIECQCRYVARLMLEKESQDGRRTVFGYWKTLMPALNEQRVKDIWTTYKSQPSAAHHGKIAEPTESK